MASYVCTKVQPLPPSPSEHKGGADEDGAYFPAVHVEAQPDEDASVPKDAQRGMLEYTYALFDGVPPSSPSTPASSADLPKIWAPQAQEEICFSYQSVKTNVDEKDTEEEDYGYYSSDALARVRETDSEPWTPSSATSGWRPAVEFWQETAASSALAHSDAGCSFASTDPGLVKAAVQRYAESVVDPIKGEKLLAHIVDLAKVIAATADDSKTSGTPRSSPSAALPVLAQLPFSYGSQIVNMQSSSPRLGSSVGDIGLRDKASVMSQEAMKNTIWNQSYQELIDAGIQNMPLASVKRLLRLANDFVYTCKTYAQVIVNELNMPIDKKTIKPATHIGGIAGGEKYVVQGILFKFCLDPQVSTKGEGVWLYGGSRPSEEKAAKAAGLELQGLSLISSLFLPHVHQPFMALIDFKGFRILTTSLLPIGPDTICYGSHDAGKTVHASDPNFNRLMEEIGGLLNLKKHTVSKKKVPIVGPGDIEGHKGLDGRYYLLDYARLMPSQAPIPSEDGTWDGRGVFYQMLRPELVRSYKTPLSSDVFTGWSIHDEAREESEKEVIAATRIMINERVPALAAELNTLDTSSFREIYSRNVSVELNPDKILWFLNMVNLESRMHRAGINCRHMGRLRQLIQNPDMRSFVLSVAVSRVLKHKLRNRMRTTVRTDEKRQGDLVSVVSCKRVGARVLNLILGQHPKSADFWQKSVIKSLRKRFPFILSPEEQAEGHDIRGDLFMRVLMAIVTTQSMLRLSSRASNAIFTVQRALRCPRVLTIEVLAPRADLQDPSTVKLVSSDIEVILANAKFNPIINLLDAEVKRRMAAGEKNSALRLRLLEAARAKLKQAVDAMPSCAYLYRSVARVCRMQLAHPEYDIFAEQVFRGIYTYLEYAFNMEKTRGTLVAWAQTLEMHAERLEKANDGAPTQRSAELRAMAADKRAQALAMPRHHSDNSDDHDETSVLI